MKKMSMFVLVSLLSVGFIFATDFAPSKRSTELSKNPARSGYLLLTDGTYNYWGLFDGGLLTNVPASIVQPGTFPAGNYTFQGDVTVKGSTYVTNIYVTNIWVTSTTTSLNVSGSASIAQKLILGNGEYFINDQDTYIKAAGHLVSLGNGTFNLGSSTQQFGYLYLKQTANTEDLVARNSLTVGTNATVGGNLVISGVVSGNCSGATSVPITITKQTGAVTATAVVTPQTPGVVTPTITVTPQTPGIVTPTITVTKETGAVTASGANDLVTPTATLTPETGAITASGANNLITPTVTVTPQVVTPTATPTLQTGAVTASGANNLVTPTITVTIQTAIGYDSTGAGITNAAGEIVAMMTNATATCSPDLASNAVVVVVVTGGNAVMTNLSIAVTPDLMTNATCAITPDLASNAVVAVSVTGGGAVWTNATCAITPDLASNSVVSVSVTGGGAIMTNATAASSALPDFATNAIATCSALPDFATNATTAVSVLGGGAVMTNATASNP